MRFIYRGYLQIAAIDAISGTFQWFLVWDPTQSIATRPLAIRKDGTWYAYGWDLTKNICEVFGPAGYIRTAYTYTPYGTVTASGDVTQSIQYSSEILDEETHLLFYNFRSYNNSTSSWLSRDPIDYYSDNNLYNFNKNKPIIAVDFLGLLAFMSCVRFSDLSMICLISMLHGLCNCEECKKIAKAMYSSTTTDSLLKNSEKLFNCAMKNRRGSEVSVEAIGPIFTNYATNAGRGPIPADTVYRVLPKPNGKQKNEKNGNGINYHKGTPSPTDLNSNIPGRLYDPALKSYRGSIRIHELGLSEGCITIGSRYVDAEGKSIPLVSSKTGEGYIEQIMNEHNQCGGFYLEILNIDDAYMPEDLKKSKSTFIPNTAISTGRQVIL